MPGSNKMLHVHLDVICNKTKPEWIKKYLLSKN